MSGSVADFVTIFHKLALVIGAILVALCLECIGSLGVVNRNMSWVPGKKHSDGDIE